MDIENSESSTNPESKFDELNRKHPELHLNDVVHEEGDVHEQERMREELLSAEKEASELIETFKKTAEVEPFDPFTVGKVGEAYKQASDRLYKAMREMVAKNYGKSYDHLKPLL